MTTTYILFRCEADGKLFKVCDEMAGEGPKLEQYDGVSYNLIQELDVYHENGAMTEDYMLEVIREGMRVASIHTSCGTDEFVIEDTNEKIREGLI